jgi:hypothetical protein
VFLGGQQNLQDPQGLNAYSYAEDNPVTKEDQNGKVPTAGPFTLAFAVAGAFYGIGTQLDQDLTSGQTTSVPGYVEAGLRAAGLFAVGGVSIENPIAIGVPVIRTYGYYQTGQDAYNLVNELYSPTSYSTTESLQTASNVYVDEVRQTIESILVPAQYRNIYESLNSIYDSLEAISEEESVSSNSNQNASQVSGSSGGESSGGSGGGNEIYTTPSGAQVTGSGQLVAPPPSNWSPKL